MPIPSQAAHATLLLMMATHIMETGERIELPLIQGQEPLLLEPCSRNLHARLALVQVVLLILSVMLDWLVPFPKLVFAVVHLTF
jgi:hypothetical protein